MRAKTRAAEQAVGAARVKIVAIEAQINRDFPRLKAVITCKFNEAANKAIFHIKVAHKEQHVYLIDEEEDADIFPSEWLLARMGLVG